MGGDQKLVLIVIPAALRRPSAEFGGSAALIVCGSWSVCNQAERDDDAIGPEEP
jgi:hypothetical protein